MSSRSSSSGRGGQPTKRYPDAPYRRMALAPGIIAAIVVLAGLALLGLPSYIFILYPVSILALIIGYFAIQARHWWWLPPLAAIAVLWNPVYPFAFTGTWWQIAQYIATAVFIGAAVLIRVRNTEDRNQRR